MTNKINENLFFLVDPAVCSVTDNIIFGQNEINKIAETNEIWNKRLQTNMIDRSLRVKHNLIYLTDGDFLCECSLKLVRFL